MSDCLYVMANHGVLLEYALDPIPDSSKFNNRIIKSNDINITFHRFNWLYSLKLLPF